MKYVIWALVVLLVILHQDNWNWHDTGLVFGFIPVGLAWHAGISIAASTVWFLATLFAWPKDLDSVDQQASQQHVQEVSS